MELLRVTTMISTHCKKFDGFTKLSWRLGDDESKPRHACILHFRVAYIRRMIHPIVLGSYTNLISWTYNIQILTFSSTIDEFFYRKIL